MTTSTTTTTHRATLSCNHVVDLTGPAEEGDRVDCEKCSAGKPSPRSRRIKRLVTTTADEPTITVTLPEPDVTVYLPRTAITVTDANTGEVIEDDVAPGAQVHAVVFDALGDDGPYDVQAARDEWKALKAWQTANGTPETRPDTTNLDRMNAAHAAGKPRSGRKARKDAAPKRQRDPGLRFHVGDRPMPNSQNKLSSVAWQATRGLGADGGRLSTKELVALLAANGIVDPEAGAWSFTLANGVTISTTV